MKREGVLKYTTNLNHLPLCEIIDSG